MDSMESNFLFAGIAIVVIVVLATTLPWFFIFRGMRRRAQIAQTGTKAVARILSIADTGVTMNNDPQVRMTIAIERMGADPLQAEIKQVVSRLSLPRIGQRVYVAYNPANPSQAVVDTQTQLPDSGVDPIIEAQDVSDHGAQGMAKLAQAIEVAVPAGTLQPGQSVFDLTLDVTPNDGSTPFRATMRTGFSTPERRKLVTEDCKDQLPVRYDPNDRTKIIIDGKTMRAMGLWAGDASTTPA